MVEENYIIYINSYNTNKQINLFLKNKTKQNKKALMEYQMTKQSTIASRIFELGMKVFASPNGVNDDYKSEEAQKFISQYLDWLISLNDDNSNIILI